MSSESLLKMPIGFPLLKLALPTVIGLISIFMFQLVDSIYVGQLGTEALAAIGYTVPVIFTVLSLTFGLGIGVSSVLSRTIGSGQTSKVASITTHSLFLAVAVVAVISGIGLSTFFPLFKLIGVSNPVIMDMVWSYMSIWYLGLGFLIVPVMGNNAIRATGDMKTPSIIMISGGLVNAIVDPFLIFGWGPFPVLGIKGAAIATVISWIAAMSVSLSVLIFREKMIDWSIPKLPELFQSWKAILYVGVPAGITNTLFPLVVGFLTSIIAPYGDAHVAAYGVGMRLEPLVISIIIAIEISMGPFFGQNWGAGQLDRVRDGLRFIFKFVICWELGMYVLGAVLAPYIARVFSDDPEVIRSVVMFLRIVPLGYCGAAISIITEATMNAINRPLIGTTMGVVRLFFILLPITYGVSMFYGVKEVFLSIMITSLLGGALSYFWLRSLKLFQKVSEPLP